MKKYLKKFSPNKEKVLSLKILRPVAHLLTHSKIWHFNRHSVSGGVAVGLFFSMFPIPMQMAPAAFFAILFRVNLPLAMASVWITNPITMPVVFSANYYIGACILGQNTHLPEHFRFSEIFQFGMEILGPLFLGSLVMAIVCACSSYVIIQALWKYNTYQMRQARRLREVKKKSQEISQSPEI